MNATSCADCALTSSVNELQLSQPPFQRKKEGHRHHRGRGAAVAGWRSYRRDELHRFGGLSGWRRQLAGRHGRTGDDPMPTRRPVKARTESPTPAQGQRARSARQHKLSGNCSVEHLQMPDAESRRPAGQNPCQKGGKAFGGPASCFCAKDTSAAGA